MCAPFDFRSSASVVVIFGVGFGSSATFVSGFGVSCFGGSGLGVSGFFSGVAAFFSVVVVAVTGAAGVTVGAFSFSGVDLTRHFSGSSKAAFSSWSSSSDLAVLSELLRLREEKRESCVKLLSEI